MAEARTVHGLLPSRWPRREAEEEPPDLFGGLFGGLFGYLFGGSPGGVDGEGLCQIHGEKTAKNVGSVPGQEGLCLCIEQFSAACSIGVASITGRGRPHAITSG